MGALARAGRAAASQGAPHDAASHTAHCSLSALQDVTASINEQVMFGTPRPASCRLCLCPVVTPSVVTPSSVMWHNKAALDICVLQVKLVAAPVVGEGDAAVQMARCNVSKDAYYSGAVRSLLLP